MIEPEVGLNLTELWQVGIITLFKVDVSTNDCPQLVVVVLWCLMKRLVRVINNTEPPAPQLFFGALNHVKCKAFFFKWFELLNPELCCTIHSCSLSCHDGSKPSFQMTCFFCTDWVVMLLLYLCGKVLVQMLLKKSKRQLCIFDWNHFVGGSMIQKDRCLVLNIEFLLSQFALIKVKSLHPTQSNNSS